MSETDDNQRALCRPCGCDSAPAPHRPGCAFQEKRTVRTVIVDGRKFQLQSPATGTHIKVASKVLSSSALWLDAGVDGDQDKNDRQIGDNETLNLVGGERFYSVPTATM